LTFISRAGAAVLCRSATNAAATFFSSIGPAVRQKGAGVTSSTTRNFFLHGSKTKRFNKMRQIRRGREECGNYGQRRGRYLKEPLVSP
jgi:hypothetical protein